MSLRDALNTIIQSVDGSLAAIIMAYDGIPIDRSLLNSPSSICSSCRSSMQPF